MLLLNHRRRTYSMIKKLLLIKKTIESDANGSDLKQILVDKT